MIKWTDGTFTDPTRTRVTDFTAFQVRYTVRGVRQEELSDKVAIIEVAAVRDAYRRGFTSGDPGQALSTAIVAAPLLALFLRLDGESDRKGLRMLRLSSRP